MLVQVYTQCKSSSLVIKKTFLPANYSGRGSTFKFCAKVIIVEYFWWHDVIFFKLYRASLYLYTTIALHNLLLQLVNILNVTFKTADFSSDKGEQLTLLCSKLNMEISWSITPKSSSCSSGSNCRSNVVSVYLKQTVKRVVINGDGQPTTVW